jgi:hypothetical protein
MGQVLTSWFLVVSTLNEIEVTVCCQRLWELLLCHLGLVWTKPFLHIAVGDRQ